MMTVFSPDAYLAALRPGDRIVFRTEFSDRAQGVFVRPAGTSITARINPAAGQPRGATAILPAHSLVRACCRCGCTDDRACIVTNPATRTKTGCAWADIKTCTRCAPMERNAA